MATSRKPSTSSAVPAETSTSRVQAHLKRLTASEGKRVLVDLNAPAATALASLCEAGYAENQSAVIRKALIAVATSAAKKAVTKR